MKQLLNNITLAGLLMFSVVGCANLQANAGKSLATVATTVDATMHGWAAWVATGNVNQQQSDQVKAAYQQYQTAMSLALTAYLEFTTTKDSTAYSAAFANLTIAKDKIVLTTQTLKQQGQVKL